MSLVSPTFLGAIRGCVYATIELGCAWVEYCLHVLDHAGLSIIDRNIEAFGQRVDERPSEVFRRHFWVSPFPEEDVEGLTRLIGSDRVLFGSDWPHAEGTEQPADYVRYIDKLDPGDVRLILRERGVSTETPVLKSKTCWIERRGLAGRRSHRHHPERPWRTSCRWQPLGLIAGGPLAGRRRPAPAPGVAERL